MVWTVVTVVTGLGWVGHNWSQAPAGCVCGVVLVVGAVADEAVGADAVVAAGSGGVGGRFRWFPWLVFAGVGGRLTVFPCPPAGLVFGVGSPTVGAAASAGVAGASVFHWSTMQPQPAQSSRSSWPMFSVSIRCRNSPRVSGTESEPIVVMRPRRRPACIW